MMNRRGPLAMVLGIAGILLLCVVVLAVSGA